MCHFTTMSVTSYKNVKHAHFKTPLPTSPVCCYCSAGRLFSDMSNTCLCRQSHTPENLQVNSFNSAKPVLYSKPSLILKHKFRLKNLSQNTLATQRGAGHSSDMFVVASLFFSCNALTVICVQHDNNRVLVEWAKCILLCPGAGVVQWGDIHSTLPMVGVALVGGPGRTSVSTGQTSGGGGRGLADCCGPQRAPQLPPPVEPG